MEIHDIDIIDKILQGDINQFEQLVDKYKDKVFKLVSSHVPYDDIDEVANDVFFACYKSLASYRMDAPFVNWLSVIAVRTCKNFWRNKYRDMVVPISSFDIDIDYFVDNIDQASSPENELLNKELANKLSEALDVLKPSERMVINMLYVEGRSIAEIAELMEMSDSNVKVTAFRARKKLTDIINKDFAGANK